MTHDDRLRESIARLEDRPNRGEAMTHADRDRSEIRDYMSREGTTTLGAPIRGTVDGQRVSFIVDGVIESYDSELGKYRIRGNSRGAQHIDWTIDAHWATQFYETPAIARIEGYQSRDEHVAQSLAGMTDGWRAEIPQTPASDATCPPDATEAPEGIGAGGEAAEGRTEAQREHRSREALIEHNRQLIAERREWMNTARDRMAERDTAERALADERARWKVSDAALREATERAEAAEARVAAGLAAVDNMPLIVSGILRDMELTPEGRGGELRHDPATLGHGASGCPGDNLARWPDEIRAALAGDA